MATFALFDEVINYVLSPALITTNSPIDFEADAFYVALSNTAIGTTEQAAYNTLADVTQISAAFGYTSGGNIAANPTVTETSGGSGIWQFTTDDITFTAAGGTMATFQYPVLYDTDTAVAEGDLLVGFLNYGSGVSLADGNSFTINVGTNGWFQITVPNYA